MSWKCSDCGTSYERFDEHIRHRAEIHGQLKGTVRLMGDTKAVEAGWLVEFSRAFSGRVQYWGRTEEGLGLTTESIDALRFARQRDAEDFIEDNGWTECKAVEHQWQ